MNALLVTQLCVYATLAAPPLETLLDPNAIRTWDIVVADAATEAEKYAAKEFRLNPGERFEYAYMMAFLTKPPDTSGETREAK